MARRVHAHQPIVSRKAPKPIGPYAAAIRIEQPGASLYVSGQIPIEMPSGQVFTGAFKRQAELALMHLRAMILDAGFRVDEVVKVVAYLTDMAHLDAFNEAFVRVLAGTVTPARSVVGVAALPRGVAVEVEAVAVRAHEAMAAAPPEPPPPEEEYDY